MDTLPVTRLFAQVNTYRTPSSREAERAAIAAAMASYTGTIEQLPAFRHKPAPARREWIDPDTVLKRAKPDDTDAKILEAISNKRDSSCADIAKALRKAGIRALTTDVERVATLRGMQIPRYAA